MAKTKFIRFEKRDVERLETKSLLTTFGGTDTVDVELESIETSAGVVSDELSLDVATPVSDAEATTESPTDDVLTGDVNGDGIVGFQDFLDLARNFGAKDATLQQGDVNGDGKVGFQDFLDLAGNFGASSDEDAIELVEHPVDEILLGGHGGPFGSEGLDPHPDFPDWEDGYWCPPCGMG